MILLIGGDGLLGKKLREFIGKEKCIYTSRRESEGSIYFDEKISIKEIFDKYQHIQFKRIIVCAAISDVAECEKNKDACWKTNVLLPKRVQEEAAKYNIPCTVFSSEYVFDGLNKKLYTELSNKSPETFYGKSKAFLEKLTLKKHPENLIFRISKLASFDDNRSFINRMYNEMAAKREYRAANDQIFSPIDIKDAVRIIESAQEQGLKGLFNLCGNISISRLELANILNTHIGKACNIKTCDIEDMQCCYKIPPDLSMDSTKIRSALKLKELELPTPTNEDEK